MRKRSFRKIPGVDKEDVSKRRQNTAELDDEIFSGRGSPPIIKEASEIESVGDKRESPELDKLETSFNTIHKKFVRDSLKLIELELAMANNNTHPDINRQILNIEKTTKKKLQLCKVERDLLIKEAIKEHECSVQDLKLYIQSLNREFAEATRKKITSTALKKDTCTKEDISPEPHLFQNYQSHFKVFQSLSNVEISQDLESISKALASTPQTKHL